MADDEIAVGARGEWNRDGWRQATLAPASVEHLSNGADVYRVALQRFDQGFLELCWLCASDQRPWLLGELKRGRDTSTLVANLTHQEARVLRLLMQGLSNRELTERLGISIATVKTHIMHVLAKLKADSRAKAAQIGRRVWPSE